VKEKLACELNEIDETDCTETVKTAIGEKTLPRDKTENDNAFDKDRSNNRRPPMLNSKPAAIPPASALPQEVWQP